MTRKVFLQFVFSTAGASALGVTACGDDEGSGGAGGTTGTTTGSTSGTQTSTKSSTTTTSTKSSSSGSTSGETSSSTGNMMLTCGTMIATNHPQAHTMEVTAAEVEAGADMTYDIMGASMHTHSVTLTAADFATLAQGGSVTKTSTMGGMHTHEVTVTCTLE
ncbi:MAG: hypothetical protein HOV80_09720 [Polyangiaceae bacterium]|nr:hypothetical protein [Polyangiaceae bacterium]